MRALWFAADQAEQTNARGHVEMSKMFLEMNLSDEALVEAAVALCMPSDSAMVALALEASFEPRLFRGDLKPLRILLGLPRG